MEPISAQNFKYEKFYRLKKRGDIRKRFSAKALTALPKIATN